MVREPSITQGERTEIPFEREPLHNQESQLSGAVAPPFDRRHDNRLGTRLTAPSAALDASDVRLIGFHEPVPGDALGKPATREES